MEFILLLIDKKRREDFLKKNIKDEYSKNKVKTVQEEKIYKKIFEKLDIEKTD